MIKSVDKIRFFAKFNALAALCEARDYGTSASIVPANTIGCVLHTNGPRWIGNFARDRDMLNRIRQ